MSSGQQQHHGKKLRSFENFFISDQARSIAVTPAFYVETGAFDRDGQFAYRHPSLSSRGSSGKLPFRGPQNLSWAVCDRLAITLNVPDRTRPRIAKRSRCRLCRVPGLGSALRFRCTLPLNKALHQRMALRVSIASPIGELKLNLTKAVSSANPPGADPDQIARM